MAQTFLRQTAKARFVEACLEVIDNGSILNPCMEDLRGRGDIDSVKRLGSDVTVVDVTERNGVAEVSAADLSPEPTWSVTLLLERSRTDSRWKVRELNGQEIHWKVDS